MIALNDLKEMAEVKGPCLSVFQPLGDNFAHGTKTDAGLLAAVHLADKLLQEKGFDDVARYRFPRPLAKIANRTNCPGRSGASCGPSNGRMKAVRSGVSSFRETKGQYIRDFFRMIDRAVCPIMSKSRDPLVLAGVPRELTAYREINSYAGLLDEAIHGSPDAMGEEYLRRAALELIHGRSAQATRQVRRYLEAAAGQGLLAVDFDEIAEAAPRGNVDHLYVTEAVQGNEDSLNETLLEVIRHAGKVDFIEARGLESGIAAALRYRAPKAKAFLAEGAAATA